MISKNDQDVIIHGESQQKVNVYFLDGYDFEPNLAELHIFANCDGQWLVFQTVKWNYGDMELFTEAARWYACYAHDPEMAFSPDDPRVQRA